MFCFFMNIFSAFIWLSWAFGFLEYSHWVVPAAFVFIAIERILDAMKDLLKWAAA